MRITMLAALALATACTRTVPVAPSPAPTPVPAVPIPEARPAPPRMEPATPDSNAPRDSTRADSARRARPNIISAAFTGDINLGTSTLPAGLPPDSGRAVLRAATPMLTGDLVVGNLEGVLADTGTSEKCIRRIGKRVETKKLCYAFRTPTYLASRLKDAGFTHLNLANNHSGDLGAAGRESTIAVLDSLGLAHYGPLGSIVLVTVQRGDSASIIGLVGFSTYPFSYNLLELDQSTAVVDSVRHLADVLLVTFHGGTEGADAQHVDTMPEFLGREPRGDLRQWAHAVIDAGADAVIGHGPHVLRGIEFYRGKPIAYSLGNFATYRGFSLEGPLGITAVLQLEFSGTGDFIRGSLTPMYQARGEGPRLDPERRAVALVRALSNADFGPNAAIIRDDGTILAPGGASH
jgi:hypothetical protein